MESFRKPELEEVIEQLKEQLTLIQKRHEDYLSLISWWDLDEEGLIKKDSHNINYLI